MRINLGAVPSCILDACLERSVCLSVFFVYCLYAYVCPFANSLVFFQSNPTYLNSAYRHTVKQPRQVQARIPIWGRISECV